MTDKPVRGSVASGKEQLKYDEPVGTSPAGNEFADHLVTLAHRAPEARAEGTRARGHEGTEEKKEKESAAIERASRRALAAYLGAEQAQRARIEPLQGGLINLTFAVESGERALILQRLNPIFSPAIHDNIIAVSEQLRQRGEQSPVLLQNADRQPFVDLDDAGIWRLMTRLPGETFASLCGPEGPARARSAGALIARFHDALADLQHSFRGLRSGVHDTEAHLTKLGEALVWGRQRDHRLLPEVRALSASIRGAAALLPVLSREPSFVVHGDLKISNVLFDGSRAHALIDLDTVARMPLWMELGDAWRSWCNPGGEDQSTAHFDLDLFAASARAYLGTLRTPLSAEVRRSLVHGVEWIALELAARFAADAIFENYFGWDRSRFAAAGEHNLLRARGQWALFQAALETRPARENLLLGGS